MSTKMSTYLSLFIISTVACATLQGDKWVGKRKQNEISIELDGQSAPIHIFNMLKLWRLALQIVLFLEWSECYDFVSYSNVVHLQLLVHMDYPEIIDTLFWYWSKPVKTTAEHLSQAAQRPQLSQMAPLTTQLRKYSTELRTRYPSSAFRSDTRQVTTAT